MLNANWNYYAFIKTNVLLKRRFKENLCIKLQKGRRVHVMSTFAKNNKGPLFLMCHLQETVIAGETSAGKSTLINLLIGDELLPYSVLHKTAAICCLRHSEEKRLVYEVSGALHEDHFENNIATEVVNDKIDKLMEDPDVKLINIYWPIPILKKQVNRLFTACI